METQLQICGPLSAVQTYTAIYYVMADLLMLGMYTYYKVKNRMNQGEFVCFSLKSGRINVAATYLQTVDLLNQAGRAQISSVLLCHHAIGLRTPPWLLTFDPVTPVPTSDRRILHVVGVACVLGFSASFARLPGASSHQEMIPSDFKSRSLLWTTDDSGIRVSPVRRLVGVQSHLPQAVCDSFSFSFSSL